MSEKVDIMFAAFLGPKEIERQEAREQRTACAKVMIGREMDTETRRALTEAGVVFTGEGDDVLEKVQLPAGWRLVPTDHSMWSHLVDAGGGVRAKCFYKGAFYDRRADVHICTRFRIGCEYGEGTQIALCVIDSKRPDVPLLKTGWASCGLGSHPEEASVLAWLDAQYPDWRNPGAHWDSP